MELNVKTEFCFLYWWCQVINVFHHQSPVAHLRTIISIFQRLNEYGLVNICIVWGKLTHLISLSVERIFISHSQNLVGLQTCLQRDITHCCVHWVLRRGKQSCALHLFIVHTTSKTADSIEHGICLVYIAGCGILAHHWWVESVCGISWRYIACAAPHIVSKIPSFAKVCKSHEIARVACCSAFVCHPHLNTRNPDARGHIRQRCHPSVVALAEIMTKEEMSVFLVISGVYLKRRHLRASAWWHTLSSGVFLRNHCLQFQFAKLHICTHTEERRCSFYERWIRWEGNISCLNKFYNLVFLALITQFYVFGIPVKGSVGIVVKVHVHLISNLTIDIQIYFLVKVKSLSLSVSYWQWGVVYILHRHAHLQLCRTLCLYAHSSWSEYFLCWSKVEVHITERELILSLTCHILSILFAEELSHRAALTPFAILLWGHQQWGIKIRVAYLWTNEIKVERVIIYSLLLYIVRHFQV